MGDDSKEKVCVLFLKGDRNQAYVGFSVVDFHHEMSRLTDVDANGDEWELTDMIPMEKGGGPASIVTWSSKQSQYYSPSPTPVFQHNDES